MNRNDRRQLVHDQLAEFAFGMGIAKAGLGKVKSAGQTGIKKIGVGMKAVKRFGTNRIKTALRSRVGRTAIRAGAGIAAGAALKVGAKRMGSSVMRRAAGVRRWSKTATMSRHRRLAYFSRKAAIRDYLLR
jgi:hypothetical protein